MTTRHSFELMAAVFACDANGEILEADNRENANDFGVALGIRDDQNGPEAEPVTLLTLQADTEKEARKLAESIGEMPLAVITGFVLKSKIQELVKETPEFGLLLDAAKAEQEAETDDSVHFIRVASSEDFVTDDTPIH